MWCLVGNGYYVSSILFQSCQWSKISGGCKTNRWIWISELRPWNTFWRRRDHYSVQKSLQNEKWILLCKTETEFNLSINASVKIGSCESPYSWFFFMNEWQILLSIVWQIFQDESLLSWHAAFHAHQSMMAASCSIRCQLLNNMNQLFWFHL